MAKDYKLLHVQGDGQLAECLRKEEDEGYELLQIIWTGNVQANPGQVPGMLVGPTGQQQGVAIIHLYLVMFVRMSMGEARDQVDEAMGKKRLSPT